MDLLLANFQSLISRFRKPTALARRLFDEYGENSDDLKWLLRHHCEKPITDEETWERDSFDNLISFYSILEVASIIRVIPEPLPAPFLDKAIRHLAEPSVRRFYRQYYPLLLPKLFLKRLSGNHAIHEERNEEAISLFMDFLELDIPFDRSWEMDRFLWLLDGGRVGKYNIDHLVKVIGDSAKFIKHVSIPKRKQSEFEEALHGMGIFLQFCRGFCELLDRARKQRLLQSAMWHYYEYWFRGLRREIGTKMVLAIKRFSEWGSDLVDDRDRNETATSLQEMESVLCRLTSKEFLVALEETARTASGRSIKWPGTKQKAPEVEPLAKFKKPGLSAERRARGIIMNRFGAHAGVSALDEMGKPVDWWFLYKVPRLAGTSAQIPAATGYEYLYYDPKVGRLGLSQNRLTDSKGALNLTLNAIFEHPASTIGWILYNDEMPASVGHKDDGTKGQTKGIIGFDTASETAFWLLHSWPKFAEPKPQHDPTAMHGQTYLCISLDIATARKIAAQMANHQEPQTYLCQTADLPNTDPLYILSQPLAPNPPVDTDVIDLKSRGGLAFKVIAKNREWNGDFWNGLVGPSLGNDMDVETWIRGEIPPVLDSGGIHRNLDLKYIDMRPLGCKWAWPETQDHAKWGIATDSYWVCVGDINRMISQEKRGGGVIAFQDPTLWGELKRTDLIVPPANMTAAEARDIIKRANNDARADAPTSARAVTKSKASGGSKAKARKMVPR